MHFLTLNYYRSVTSTPKTSNLSEQFKRIARYLYSPSPRTIVATRCRKFSNHFFDFLQAAVENQFPRWTFTSCLATNNPRDVIATCVPARHAAFAWQTFAGCRRGVAQRDALVSAGAISVRERFMSG